MFDNWLAQIGHLGSVNGLGSRPGIEGACSNAVGPMFIPMACRSALKGRWPVGEHTSRLLLWLLAVVITGTALLSGCSASGQAYSEKVSRLLVGDSPRLYWLDNDRVFVPGYAPDDKLLDEDGKPKKGLYILDTRNNTYVRHADLGYGSRFCYYQGFITYTVSWKMGEPMKSARQMEGIFGQEQLLPLGTRFNAEFNSHNSSYTDCPKVDRAKRLRPEHAGAVEEAAYAVFLREEDGYILRTGPGKDFLHAANYGDLVKLFRPDRADPIELPILAKELSLGSYIRYVDWLDKYLIVSATRRDAPYGHGGNLPGKAPYQIYLMAPEGEVEAIPLRDGRWLPPMDAAYTRAGLFLLGNAGTAQGEGGWLVKANGQRVRLFEQHAPARGVSPDGCKLAYATHHHPKAEGDGLVRVIDFCSKN